MKDLKSSEIELERGLSSDEVQERRRKHGYNEVPERKESVVIRFLKRFWGLTPWMLELTVILTWLTGKYLESYIIIGLLFFNAFLGFFQEGRANSALNFLKQRLQVNARVKRDGIWTTLPAKELVPDDVVRLRAGDFIPADVKAMHGTAEVDQSYLTGESLTVQKKVGDVLFSGALIKKGEITGVVTATGKRTYFGRTVELVQIARPKLHMEEVISKFVRWLLVMVIILLIIGLAFTIINGMNLLGTIPLVIVLLVSAVPVALPTMFTISMALGSLELAKMGVLVTRLSATEDAATMDTVCVDKTGTLTMNRLSIVEAISVGKYEKRDVITYGALASNEANQDPIDRAFLLAAKDLGISLDRYTQRRFVPFDPSNRRTEATIEKEGHLFEVLKGALGTVIPLCRNNEDCAKIMNDIEIFEAKGYRVLAVATGPTIDNVELVGVVALSDRPRPDSLKLIKELKDLGISVKMLTGDALAIAKEVAEQLGLGDKIGRMTDLKESQLKEFNIGFIEERDGFAEIYPEDKYLIVKSLQKAGHVVGMTGDGVNDAPSLKQAEVGIAVSNATDAAKESAGAVLTVEGLEGIVNLIKNGRMIHQRIITWMLNKITKTFQVVVFVILAFLITKEYVVSLLSMILLLFLTDFATLSISTDRVGYSKKPDSWNTSWLVKLGVVLGAIIVLESLLFLFAGFSLFGLENQIDKLPPRTILRNMQNARNTIYRNRTSIKAKPCSKRFHHDLFRLILK